MLVVLGLVAFVAIVSIASGVMFYINFSGDLVRVRDEVMLPVAKRFVDLVEQGSYQAAYELLSEEAKEEWPPEKFGKTVEEIDRELGAMTQFDMFAQPTEAVVTRARGSDLVEGPFNFPCQYERGTCTFAMEVRRYDGVWRIKKLQSTIDVAKKKSVKKADPVKS
jgi:hypothetical protein